MTRVTVVWSAETLAHDPGAEIWLGTRTPGTEVAERVTVIRDELAAGGFPIVEAAPHGDEVLRSVHDPAFVDHLHGIWQKWEDGGYPRDYGQDRVVPYVFPTEAMLAGMPAHDPAATHARAGLYCYDTMTLVGPGTWRAARAAVDAAQTAADLVASGERVAYALCRPPGHHATPAGYGGSCYLNNAAVAAQALRDHGFARVAIIDVDAHHGNGTQAIFWDRPDVFYGSAHVDPGAGWFPHYFGFAHETGAGPGHGTTLNIPIAPESGDAAWLSALTRLRDAAEAFGAEAVVVSLGVDAAADDPESPLRVTTTGYHETGSAIASLGLPTVAVQEGGYHLPSLGTLVTATLRGLSG
ncbi:acetylpolyamine amidohydrolase [Acrocarpospora phusangensis]|uniref:Acetylpolyamine amidohydrolase n=1 Tax=Acrocarpospora phusangensis TaxID=1070424 RepID=A0A919ULI2_9ACTN|nr:histone deacetylase family protein [Acrocarpospora phusangensis]GIH26206.1 acetylpolyamine amidohydrolase [Acrocarpospora phusangensis]